jgi:hypothetical protein
LYSDSGYQLCCQAGVFSSTGLLFHPSYLLAITILFPVLFSRKALALDTGMSYAFIQILMIKVNGEGTTL